MNPLPSFSEIEQLLIIFDVDGVVRDSIEAPADERVVRGVKSLLARPLVQVCFLSGTPVKNDPNLEAWRRGNRPLCSAFGSTFDEELLSGKVAIYGMLGGQKMRADGGVDVLDSYPLEVSFALQRLAVEAFLQEFLLADLPEKKQVASDLLACVKGLKLNHLHQSAEATPLEFAEVVGAIRSHLDPGFCLINNGAGIEAHITVPFYQPLRAYTFVERSLAALLLKDKPYLSRGIAKKGSQEFHFLLMSKGNKGQAFQQIVREQKRGPSPAFVITVGDTQLDFLMHQHAHLAFHVGIEEVWKSHALPHCILIRGPNGEDKQHVEGTLKILQMLQDGLRTAGTSSL